MNRILQTRMGILLFILAVFMAFGISFFAIFLKPRATMLMEPLALSKHDAQYVAEQIVEICQTKVPEQEIYRVFAVDSVSAKANEITVPVLIYHRLVNDDAPSREVITPEAFEEQLKLIKELGYNTIKASELTDYMMGKRELPKKSIMISFDDGWKDNLVASNLLMKYSMKGTFYIITGFFNNPSYLNETDIINLSKNPNFEIGSHTHTHFIKYDTKLNELDLCNMSSEMVSSKLILERLIGQPVKSIAWPYGYNTREAIYAAYKFGYTSTMMVNRTSQNAPGSTTLDIHRLNVNGSCPISSFKQMLETGELNECNQ